MVPEEVPEGRARVSTFGEPRAGESRAIVHVRRTLTTLAAAVFAIVLLIAPARAQQGAHHHVLQVVDPSAEDLDAVGFLTQALGDAGIANEHAGFAAGGAERPGDLASMQTHAAHVLHALDPGSVDEGPGFGFGVLPSARSAVHHMEMAADAPDATENVRTHAMHVVASATNTIERAGRMIELVRAIRAADSAEEARPLAEELEALSRELRNGVDADGDGRITWREGEGGLYEAQRHMELLIRGEGLEPTGG